MKKWLLGIALAVTSAIAFALPSPHQIEDALAAHDYDSARSMVQQVLTEKPDSARAHLLDAFILEHVDHNLQAANTELANASNLDRRGDVKNSSLFGRTVAEIDSQAAQAPRHTAPVQQVQQTQQQPLVSYQAPPEKHSSHVFLWLVLFFGIGGLLAWWFIRGATRRKTDDYVPSANRTMIESDERINAPRVVSTPRTSSGYIAPPQPVIVQRTPYAQPVQSGPVIINNGGGYGRGDGFTEGLIMGEILEDSRDSRRERDRRDSGSDSWSRDSSYTPAPAPAPTPTPVSYSNERSSYSSGSDDSWSSKSSSSDSYSSSSSSSSWDSGSSSSYDSGSSSSYDSGSSGGSDW